jgi:hypothetical protein
MRDGQIVTAEGDGVEAVSTIAMAPEPRLAAV